MIKNIVNTKFTYSDIIKHPFFKVFNKNNSKQIKRRGFSVAEAMIALLIGSIALGMAAPMITKQIKQNNFADTERRILRQKIETAIPSGMVSFFNIPCNEIMPENSWRDVPDSYKGRYPRIAGTINVPKYISDPKGGSFSDETTSITIKAGETMNDSSRKIYGIIGSAYGGKDNSRTAASNRSGAFENYSRTYTGFNGGGVGLNYGYDSVWNVSFDSARVVPTDEENRPMTIGLYMCIKN